MVPGAPHPGSGVTDFGWFPAGRVGDDEEDWRVGHAKSLGVFLNGERMDSNHPAVTRWWTTASTFLFNAHHERLGSAPPARSGAALCECPGTFDPRAPEDSYGVCALIPVEGLSLVVLAVPTEAGATYRLQLHKASPSTRPVEVDYLHRWG